MEGKSEPVIPAPSPDELPTEPAETDIDPSVPAEAALAETPALEDAAAVGVEPEETRSPGRRTRTTLAERLPDLRQGKDEKRVAFLGKAARLAARHPEEELSLQDLAGLGHALIIWRFSQVDVDGESWVQARRIVRSDPVWDKRLERYGDDPRRKVGRNGDGNIVMLVRAAFTGSDLKTLFQVEKANLTAKPVLPRPLRPENPVPAPAEKSAAAEEPETPAESSDASPEEPEASKKPSQPKRPKPRRKAAKSKKRPAPVKPEYIDTPSGLRLTVDEEIALRQIAGSPEDAEAGEESDNGGASLIAAAGERNKLSREDLLTKALEDGLIDLAPLEARGNPKLTTSQEHTARLMFALEGFDERIKRLSPAGLESVHELYDALGLQPDQHALAFLIVKQAGYLED